MSTTLTTLFTNIANAIRLKTGDSAQIVAENFPAAIGAIPTGARFLGVENVSADVNGITLPEKFAGAKIVVVILGADNVTLVTSSTNLIAGVWYDGIGDTQVNAVRAGADGNSSGTLMGYNTSTRRVTDRDEKKFYATNYLVFCWG